MAGPWEKYQSAPAVKPWEKYAQTSKAVEAPTAMPEPVAEQAERTPMRDAAETITNDINAGLQGVNPVALQQQAGQSVGRIRDVPGIGQMVDVDGTLEPLSNYPGDKFVTNVVDGVAYLYPRTEDVEEGALASLGRLFGFGQIATTGPAAKAAAVSPKVQAARDAQDVGVTPTLGMRGRTGATIESALDTNPLTTGRVAKDTARVTDEIEGAASRTVAKVGTPTTNKGAGEALKAGTETFVSGVKSRAAKMYEAVDRAIPQGTKVAAPETAQALRATLEGFEDTPEIASALGLNKWAKIADDLESGNLTWRALRQLRSDIGKQVGKISGPMADMDQGRLKDLYAKLSDDLGDAAQAAGPEAYRAWNRANAYYSASQKRIEGALSKVMKADTPEKAFAEIQGLLKADSPRGSVQKLTALKKSLPADEWAEVAATVLADLGKASAGAQNAAGDVFSASTFLTNWNKMSPAARKALTSGATDKGVLEELTKLARVVERAKSAGALRNTSNTGRTVSTVATASALGAGLATNPVLTVLAAGGSVLSANALTNPRFLRALNAAAAKGSDKPLRAIAASDSPLAIEAQQLLRLQSAEQAEAPKMLPPPQ